MKECRKRLKEYYQDHSEYRKCGRVPNWLHKKIGGVDPLYVFAGAKYIGLRYYVVIYRSGVAKRYFDEGNPKLIKHMEKRFPELLGECSWSIFTPEYDSRKILNILDGAF